MHLFSNLESKCVSFLCEIGPILNSELALGIKRQPCKIELVLKVANCGTTGQSHCQSGRHQLGES